jgi:hypothetical protein
MHACEQPAGVPSGVVSEHIFAYPSAMPHARSCHESSWGLGGKQEVQGNMLVRKCMRRRQTTSISTGGNCSISPPPAPVSLDRILHWAAMYEIDLHTLKAVRWHRGTTILHTWRLRRALLPLLWPSLWSRSRRDTRGLVYKWLGAIAGVARSLRTLIFNFCGRRCSVPGNKE